MKIFHRVAPGFFFSFFPLVFLIEVRQISCILDKLEGPFSSIQGSGECCDESSSLKNGRILKKANHLKGWDTKPSAYTSESGIGLPGKPQILFDHERSGFARHDSHA